MLDNKYHNILLKLFKGEQTVPAETNENVIRNMLQAIQKGDTGAVQKYFAPNWVNHDPSLPPMRGLEGARQLIALWSGFSDMSLTIEDTVSQGDRVAMRFRLSGTQSGPVMGIAPTGKKVNITGTGIFKVVDGKATDNWVNFDALGLLQQLGAVQLPVI
jgi:predicted ester cyclase